MYFGLFSQLVQLISIVNIHAITHRFIRIIEQHQLLGLALNFWDGSCMVYIVKSKCRYTVKSTVGLLYTCKEGNQLFTVQIFFFVWP